MTLGVNPSDHAQPKSPDLETPVPYSHLSAARSCRDMQRLFSSKEEEIQQVPLRSAVRFRSDERTSAGFEQVSRHAGARGPLQLQHATNCSDPSIRGIVCVCWQFQRGPAPGVKVQLVLSRSISQKKCKLEVVSVRLLSKLHPRHRLC